MYTVADVLAAFAIASSLGTTIGPILSGVFKDRGGIQWAFYFAGAAGYLSIILFNWFSRPRRAKAPLPAPSLR